MKNNEEYVKSLEDTLNQLIDYTEMLETTIRTTHIALELKEYESATIIISNLSDLIKKFINDRKYFENVSNEIDDMLKDIGCE